MAKKTDTSMKHHEAQSESTALSASQQQAVTQVQEAVDVFKANAAGIDFRKILDLILKLQQFLPTILQLIPTIMDLLRILVPSAGQEVSGSSNPDA